VHKNQLKDICYQRQPQHQNVTLKANIKCLLNKNKPNQNKERLKQHEKVCSMRGPLYISMPGQCAAGADCDAPSA